MSDNQEIVRTIRAALDALYPNTFRAEVRLLRTAGWNRTNSGYYDNRDQCALHAAGLDGAGNVYITLNPPVRECLARSENVIREGARETTTDAQITKRINLLIDFDPVRISGISSTDAEKRAACKVARRCYDWLVEQGWPEPITADSGNGYHLVYRVDLPNDPESTALIKAVLNALADRFSTDAVAVDRAVYNAARISKLYGTLAIKGSNTDERPWRRSALINVPAERVAVTKLQLQAVAELATPDQTAEERRSTAPSPAQGTSVVRGPRSAGQRAIFDLAGFIQRHGITVEREDAGAGYHKYILAECPFNPDHRAPDSMLTEGSNGSLGFKCLHNSCADKRWQDVRELFEPGCYDRTARNGTDPSRAAADRALDCELSLYDRTDTGNSERLVARYGAHLRYVEELDAWYEWTGQRWERGSRAAVIRRAIETARAIHIEANAIPVNMSAAKTDADGQVTKEATDLNAAIRDAIVAWAKTSGAEARVNSMVSLARAHLDVHVALDRLDADEYALNTPSGTVNLLGSTSAKHDPADLLTGMAGAAYHPDAECPTWLKFLERVLPDGDVREYVQRAVGYSLCGSTREQCFFFLFGGGRNGKSTFIETVLSVLGSYAARTSADTVLVRKAGGDNYELARLVGKRMVVTSEIASNACLNESLVKDITGGDTIQARQIYSKGFEFRPAFKLWMYGNHRPRVEDQDLGIWRRVRLVPFTCTIPDSEVDAELPRKLRDELDGILRWAVEGFARWRAEGLEPPAAIRRATEDYRADMDILGEWVRDCCTLSPSATESSAALYESYKTWALDNGQRPLSHKSLATRLSERGLQKHHTRSGKVWTGISLDVHGAWQPAVDTPGGDVEAQELEEFWSDG